jgi:hypothetical protein
MKMLLHEFRIPLHMKVDEYKIAELFMVATTGDDRDTSSKAAESDIVLLKNEPYDNTNGQCGDISPISGCHIPRNKGQYTLKKYTISSELPRVVAALFPEGALHLLEEAWNSYPYSFTVITSDYFKKDKFVISCESMHCTGALTQENALNLSEDELLHRSVEVLHIEETLESQKASSSSSSSSKKVKAGAGNNHQEEAHDDRTQHAKHYYDPSTYVCSKTGINIYLYNYRIEYCVSGDFSLHI